MPRKIRLNDWRYKLAQWVLSLLYGRKWHYIAPWRHSSIGVSAIFHNDGKILLARRRGNIEKVGKLSCIGGHVNLEDNESLVDCLIREVKEETALDITGEHIHIDNLISYGLIHDFDYFEMENGVNITLRFVIPLTQSQLDNIQDTEEAHEFKLYSQKEVEDIKDQLATPQFYNTLQKAFTKIQK